MVNILEGKKTENSQYQRRKSVILYYCLIIKFCEDVPNRIVMSLLALSILLPFLLKCNAHNIYDNNAANYNNNNNGNEDNVDNSNNDND